MINEHVLHGFLITFTTIDFCSKLLLASILIRLVFVIWWLIFANISQTEKYEAQKIVDVLKSEKPRNIAVFLFHLSSLLYYCDIVPAMSLLCHVNIVYSY